MYDKAIVKAALAQGWRLEPWHKKHRQLVPPGSARGIAIPNKPSPRMLQNWLSLLRRNGLRWPA